VKAENSEGPKDKNPVTKKALPLDRESSETGRRDNCGHDLRWQNPRWGDGVAVVAGRATASSEVTATFGERWVLFNRRMRKTARPVVWEGHGAQSP
jgi:hypothetical protein